MAHGNLYDARQKLKLAFLAISLTLVALFLIISNRLVEDLATEEHNKMEIWAEATRSVASNRSDVDMGLVLKILQSNSTIPIIITDSQSQILQTHNLDIPDRHGEQFLQNKLQSLKDKQQVIEIYIDEETSQYLYYDDSTLLKRLSYFPYIQLAVMILFLVIAYLALMSSKKAEQNKVWVGLSKRPPISWEPPYRRSWPGSKCYPRKGATPKSYRTWVKTYSGSRSSPNVSPKSGRSPNANRPTWRSNQCCRRIHETSHLGSGANQRTHSRRKNGSTTSVPPPHGVGL